MSILFPTRCHVKLSHRLNGQSVSGVSNQNNPEATRQVLSSSRSLEFFLAERKKNKIKMIKPTTH